jgi:hypothetical protein
LLDLRFTESDPERTSLPPQSSSFARLRHARIAHRAGCPFEGLYVYPADAAALGSGSLHPSTAVVPFRRIAAQNPTALRHNKMRTIEGRQPGVPLALRMHSGEPQRIDAEKSWRRRCIEFLRKNSRVDATRQEVGTDVREHNACGTPDAACLNWLDLRNVRVGLGRVSLHRPGCRKNRFWPQLAATGGDVRLFPSPRDRPV